MAVGYCMLLAVCGLPMNGNCKVLVVRCCPWLCLCYCVLACVCNVLLLVAVCCVLFGVRRVSRVVVCCVVAGSS